MDDRPRILIIDDAPMNISILNSLLKKDYKISVATNGVQGLATAKATHPDLILLDVMMPDMDGYEVCRRLKQDESSEHTPVIFITSMSESDDETRGFELGAVDYISKPFSQSVVTARIRTHIQLKRQADLLEKLALIDALTEIPNRRAFDLTLKREWAHCQRQHHPISIVLMDVDMFKQYNDHYGHRAGDECLMKVASALNCNRVRPYDFVGRYGGEEFIAVLTDAGVDGAHIVGERFRLAVSELQLPHAYSAAADHVTISVGVATITPEPEMLPSSLYDAADKMLYAAKQRGRNQTVNITL